MAINTSWKVEIGGVVSPTNFTSRVMSMSISQQVDVNVMGRGICRITLLNKDGALTPGGGGTYSSTDWFAQGVFIDALTNTGGADTATSVFDGVITDFALTDDGVYSTVTITAQDGLSVAGKSTSQTLAAFGTTSYQNVVDNVFDDTLYGTLNLPLLGTANAFFADTRLSASNPSVTNNSAQTFSTFADTWQTALIPSANDVMWPTTIINNVGNAEYNVRFIPADNVRTSVYRNDLSFNSISTLSGTELPFSDDGFLQEFNNDTLITAATIKGNYTGATETTATATNASKYGSRTVAYTNTLVTDATAASSMASKLSNRYSDMRMTPVELTLSSSMVKALADNTAITNYRALLDCQQFFWQKTAVTWTGSGASQQTAYCVTKSRTINVTPQNTVITIGLGDWVDNHDFILNEDQLNVNRLG